MKYDWDYVIVIWAPCGAVAVGIVIIIIIIIAVGVKLLVIDVIDFGLII